VTRSARWLRFIQSLKIRRRDQRIVNLVYNSAQQKAWALVAEKIDRREPIRLIILKARREGISTAIESWLMSMIAEGDYVNALITAHMKRPAGKIWAMSKLFVTSSPLLNKMATIGNNTINIGNSMLEVATAGSPESERGGDLTAWHASEAAFYTHHEVMTATMQSLPDSKRIFSLGVIESTANGMAGDGAQFFTEWTRAVEGDSGWLPVFLAWHEFPEYKVDGATIEEADAEEQALRERFELTDAQLAWRRLKIARDLQGDIDLFHQEYPSYPEEAFIQSGLPFFRAEHLMPLQRNLREGVKGLVTPEGAFSKQPQGYLEVFRFPEHGHTYVIGADSSMGIDDDENAKKSHSRSAAEIIDMETMEQVAEYDAVTPPHLMARHLAGMGRLYNNALIAPEVQSSGGGGGREIIVYLRDAGYWNLHRWKQPDRVQRDAGVLYGWECVDPEAKILMEDYQEVAARQVKEGDRIWGWHEHGTLCRLQTVVKRNIFVAPMVEVTLENEQTTRVSATHPFLTLRDNGRWTWRVATDVQPGDQVKYLMKWSLDYVSVVSVEPIGNGPVVGLTTDPDHTLIADGIVGHNTNVRTRPRMLARIREVVMERSAIIHSRRLYTQLSSFGENDSGRTEALQGHDDLLFAWGIGLMSRSENYFKMAPDLNAIEATDWKALGIQVRIPETPYERLKRQLAMADSEIPDRSFLEL
jgi:hypothetical protein